MSKILKADILAYFKGPGSKERKAVFCREFQARYWGGFESAVCAALNIACSGLEGWQPVSTSTCTNGTLDRKADILAYFKGPGSKERKAVFCREFQARYWGGFESAVCAALNIACSGLEGWQPVSTSTCTNGTLNAVCAKLDREV